MSGERGSGLRLIELVREVPGKYEVEGDGSVVVYGVQQDSRRVEPGDLFVAKKGAHADGARFIADARARGAVAVLAARGTSVPPGLPVVYADDVAEALAFAAAAAYGHPSFSLEVVGVTGTNGKTTCTHLIRAAIDGALGEPRCGLIGTVGHRFRDFQVEASHTTPEADELTRVLFAMRARGATHAAMEVSSIALASKRVQAVRFRVAAFTNLTQDHLDYHGDMAAYAAAKAALFTTLSPGAAVINVDDPFGAELAKRVRSPLVRVSARSSRDADVAPRELALSARGIEGTVRTPGGDVPIRSRLVGAHNVENLLVALGVVHALELDTARAADALADEVGAPGRLERVDGADDDLTVLVDYAHTPDALARVLDAVRAIAKGRLICAFGCGGDRDATKRGPMGQVAAKGADLVVVTSDNPRSEEPAAIAAPIVEAVRAAGLPAVSREDLARVPRGYVLELDRGRAIDLAVGAAAPGDVVLIAGKGHEDYQILGSEKRFFDDRVEARQALSRRRARPFPRAAGAR